MHQGAPPLGSGSCRPTTSQGRLARPAHARVGKGCHPAGLNSGDRLAHAPAQETGRPLPYEGDDFDRTGIASALEARG